ncbi:MAG: HEPN domain-containing protein [Promethearchaeota archaeon]
MSLFFLSQQIVEKLLKCVICLNREDLILGHSIKKLSDWAGNFDPSFKNLGEEISLLDTFFIRSNDNSIM